MKRYLSKTALGLALAFCFGSLVHSQPPAWWNESGVTTSSRPMDDFAVANLGQLKNMAARAAEQMNNLLPGGAGSAINSMVSAWTTSHDNAQDYATLNLGQLKAVAKKFHQRLYESGRIATMPAWSAAQGQDDFALANLGQLKKLFSFEIEGTPGGNSSGEGSSSPSGTGGSSSGGGSTGTGGSGSSGGGTSTQTSPAPYSLAAAGLKYVVKPQNAVWQSDFNLLVDENGVCTPKLGNDFSRVYERPRTVLESDHWLAVQAADPNDRDLSANARDCVLLYKRANVTDRWLLGGKNPVYVLKVPAARKDLQTNYGMKMALHEQPSGDALLAVAAARSIPGLTDNIATIDIWRYRASAPTWVPDMPASQCLALSKTALVTGYDVAEYDRTHPQPINNTNNWNTWATNRLNWINARRALVGATVPSPAELGFTDYGDITSLAVFGEDVMLGAPDAILDDGPMSPHVIRKPGKDGEGVAFLLCKYPTYGWTCRASLDPNHPTPWSPSPAPENRYRQFGASLALNERWICIGASSPDPRYLSKSAVFVLPNGALVTSAAITKLVEPALPPDETALRSFGSSVALMGNVVVVGAPMAETVSTSPPLDGRIYTFGPGTAGALVPWWDPVQIPGDPSVGGKIGIFMGNIWTVSQNMPGSWMPDQSLASPSFVTYSPVAGQSALEKASVRRLGPPTTAFSTSGEPPGIKAAGLSPLNAWAGTTRFERNFDQGGLQVQFGSIRQACKVNDDTVAGSTLFLVDCDTAWEARVNGNVLAGFGITRSDGSTISLSNEFHVSPVPGDSLRLAITASKPGIALLTSGMNMLSCRLQSKARVIVNNVSKPASTTDIVLPVYLQPRIQSPVISRYVPTFSDPNWQAEVNTILKGWRDDGYFVMSWTSGAQNNLPWPSGEMPVGLSYTLEVLTKDTAQNSTPTWKVVKNALSTTAYAYIPPRYVPVSSDLSFRVSIVDSDNAATKLSNTYTDTWDANNNGLPDTWESKYNLTLPDPNSPAYAPTLAAYTAAYKNGLAPRTPGTGGGGGGGDDPPPPDPSPYGCRLVSPFGHLYSTFRCSEVSGMAGAFSSCYYRQGEKDTKTTSAKNFSPSKLDSILAAEISDYETQSPPVDSWSASDESFNLFEPQVVGPNFFSLQWRQVQTKDNKERPVTYDETMTKGMQHLSVLLDDPNPDDTPKTILCYLDVVDTFLGTDAQGHSLPEQHHGGLVRFSIPKGKNQPSDCDFEGFPIVEGFSLKKITLGQDFAVQITAQPPVGDSFRNVKATLLPIEIKWEDILGNVDDNPDPWTDTTLGKRIFPDNTEDNPHGGLKREINVKVKIPGYANKEVFVQVFDPDDPSTESDPGNVLDPNGPAGDDNIRAAGLIADWGYFLPEQTHKVTRTLDASGEATIEFKVNQQPGNNYRVAVALKEADLNYLQVNSPGGSGFVTADNKPVPGFSGGISDLLTVWRKLYMEVDTMQAYAPPKSSPDRTTAIADHFGSGILGRAVINLAGSLRGDNFYRFGKIVSAVGEFQIVQNDTTSITINGGLTAAQQVGLQNTFEVFDDDDKDVAHPLPRPHLITEGVKKLYSRAYIDIVERTTNPTPTISFEASSSYSLEWPWPLKTNLNSGYDTYGDDSVGFWSHYLIAAYQPPHGEELDGDDCTNLLEGVTSWGQRHPILPPGGPEFSAVFLECVREHMAASTVAASFDNRLNEVVAHEIGHVPGHLDGHPETGLMADTAPDNQRFSATTLRRFRKTPTWQGKW